MTPKKVAIIQNRIIRGGRFHVISGLVKVLNELEIVPDIITLKSRVNEKDAEQFYGDRIKFNLKEIFIDLRIPSDFHILFFNSLVRLYIKKYDLVINNSNSSYMLPDWLKILSYVHYPRKDRLLSDKLSIHFPDGENKNWLNPSHIFYNSCALLYRFNNRLPTKEKVVTNSEFTKNAFIKNYDVNQNHIDVIYPPVWKEESSVDFSNKNFNVVCSLGRFAKDKRQLEQIAIAEKLPNFEFHIMGFAKEDDPYFIKCKMYKESKGLNNVHLHRSINFTEMNNIFNEAGLFIHSLRNEPFGIVTVQAIANGCIPVVHNSGGQKEIVNIDELRYDNAEHAVDVFNHLSSIDKIRIQEITHVLRENSKKYSYSNFKKKISPIILSQLGDK
ncbi:MAG: glycosyltransferase [Melioribacteraceae bacterium]|nr:glycosyltransferase [Melioribacteraceae bacterium]MCF8355560.1 glycosyltransferase [Melioribacteraceae bacterium]MCF8394235.1 glycosyltransferase [Melioribacteraceae bacterium]MCF8419956.1 glycosyltransferase [Melioribacteraceae bacterium]